MVLASFEHAKELLAEGKRDLLVHAIPDAVSNCSKACEIMAKHKGEMATECAEAYFYYGKALLELSRVESGVLGIAKLATPLTELTWRTNLQTARMLWSRIQRR